MECVTIRMTNRDLKTAIELFDKEDDPGFTITKSRQFAEDIMEVELVVNSLTGLWFLARKVQLWGSHQEKMQEMINEMKRKINETGKD